MDLFSWLKNYRPCGNDCELCVVFAWRVPRSSRVSRDWENVLARLGGFGAGVAALRFTIRLELEFFGPEFCS